MNVIRVSKGQSLTNWLRSRGEGGVHTLQWSNIKLKETRVKDPYPIIIIILLMPPYLKNLHIMYLVCFAEPFRTPWNFVVI